MNKKEQSRPPKAEKRADTPKTTPVPYLMAAAGWVFPGAGHFWQRRWGRGVALAACVFAMFLLGLAMHGKIYRYNPADIVDVGGWLVNLGAGGLYLAAKFFGYEVPEPSSASADYGTKFLLTAGLLNLLVMLDAFDLGIGRKK
jgi:hypothetical protein